MQCVSVCVCVFFLGTHLHDHMNGSERSNSAKIETR